MIDLEHKDKAVRITAVVTEREGKREIKIENVAGLFYDPNSVKIITDVGESFEVSAWDMIRAIKACAGFNSDD